MVRNFKAEHMWDRQPDNQVLLMDGLGYMVGHSEYKEYLHTTHHDIEVGGKVALVYKSKLTQAYSSPPVTIIGQ